MDPNWYIGKGKAEELAGAKRETGFGVLIADASGHGAPAAVLKIGLAFQQMGNKSEAKLAFQKVLNDYPSSPEAAQAREKLQAL